ncbi:tetratricopeptide repeat protein [Chitinophaga filiformis]|uniref:Tetratricopeptide repeat-containing protein n=1 Tax=Chitinophaga filiformis TaxID=104663 RepID=A0ABY4HWQ8_CHIFI|nr:hypothetical protein [Chitinophaga filiformis]UPK67962.1 hypothetical protein MYF79_23705 [Chitinophaga filiformis]
MANLDIGTFRLDTANEPSFSQLTQGSEIEKDAAVQKIYDLAKTKNGMEQWNDFAIALGILGKKEVALGLFKDLIERFPDHDVLRYNLALSYVYCGMNAVGRYHLIQLSQSANEKSFRKFSRESLEKFESYLGITEADDRLKDLQISYFRKAILAAAPDSNIFLSLGRLLFDRMNKEMDDDCVLELIALLERGTKMYPRDSQLMEMLLATKLWYEPYKSHHSIADQLACISPSSPLLVEYLSRKKCDTIMHSRTSKIFRVLVEEYMSGQEEFKQYALKDLAAFVFLDPTNTAYRIMYALALACNKQYAAALKQVAKAEQEPHKDYVYFFNVSQIFHKCGDKQKALDYVEKAESFVETEQDRTDLDKVIALIKNDSEWKIA